MWTLQPNLNGYGGDTSNEELEKGLEHRKTMEKCRSMPNDRKYRKRMSNAVFNDIRRRSSLDQNVWYNSKEARQEHWHIR